MSCAPSNYAHAAIAGGIVQSVSTIPSRSGRSEEFLKHGKFTNHFNERDPHALRRRVPSGTAPRAFKLKRGSESGVGCPYGPPAP
jgi:hypothetical protein